ncbi:MAG TPA: hypothetical protein PKI19_08645 [Elusimicrobiales bacterium]|nr:hypothetical protein [Elusimicrobiales bacterium]
MKKIFLLSVFLAFTGIAGAQEAGTPPQGMRGTALNLPDISALGNITGYLSDDKSDTGRNELGIHEVETAFQGYIYPEMRADIILAIHKHDGSYESEICEAKASFMNLAAGLSGEMGKVHIDFGRVNKLHTHHLPMVDKPAVLTNFFGDHELAGQGATAKYLLPFLPFYTQFQAGAWTVAGHEHGVTADHPEDVLNVNGATVSVPSLVHEDADFSPAGKVYTARLNSSFELADKTELELGVSGLKGRGAHYEEHKDNVEVTGADLTLRFWPSTYQRVTFQNEWLHLKRAVPAGTLHRDGFYSFLNYRADKYWDYGARFDYAEGAWPAISYERSVSAIVTRHLTETSYWRLQYKHRNLDGRNVSEGWLQVSFGIGPHSHELE